MNNQPSSRKSLQWNPNVRIAIPSEEHESLMAIRFADWQRLKRQLSRYSKPIPRLSNAYSILFSVGAAAGLSIIPLHLSKGLPAWVVPLYGCMSGFCLLFGAVFVLLDKNIGSHRSSDLRDVEDDMNEIEEMFEATLKLAGHFNWSIIRSTYGSQHTSIDVTQKLQDQITIEGRNKLAITVSNEFFREDPHPGVPKMLKIKYELNGIEFSKEFAEGEQVNLP